MGGKGLNWILTQLLGGVTPFVAVVWGTKVNAVLHYKFRARFPNHWGSLSFFRGKGVDLRREREREREREKTEEKDRRERGPSERTFTEFLGPVGSQGDPGLPFLASGAPPGSLNGPPGGVQEPKISM